MIANETKWLTPPQVAEILSVDPAKVRRWIESGELPASNIAARLGGLPRYRIAPADLEEFLKGRQPQRPMKQSQRARRISTEREYF